MRGGSVALPGGMLRVSTILFLGSSIENLPANSEVLTAADQSSSGSSSIYSPGFPPLSSVQVGPEHQGVAQATNHKGQQVDRWNNGEGGRPVAVVTVEGRRRRRGRWGGE